VKEGYTFLQHTTDAYIEVKAGTLERAFELAGRALFDTMCNIDSVEAAVTEEIAASGRDKIDLLYGWLEALLLKFELEGKVYSKFAMHPIGKFGEDMSVQGEIGGEQYDRKKHGSKVEVKAVTYHNMDIVEDPSGVRLTYLLDL